MTSDATPNDPTLQWIFDRIATKGGFSTADVMALQRDLSFVNGLTAEMPNLAPRFRGDVYELLAALGHPTLPEAGELPERPAPYLSDPGMISWLVYGLADPDSDVRNLVCGLLVSEVPELLLRDQSAGIVDRLIHLPETEGAAMLLGRTGCARARALILANESIREADSELTAAALGRLGDRAAEESVIKEYEQCVDPADKRVYAQRLGYMATPRAILTLARDLRDPGTYVWKMQSSRSVRIDIIAALHTAFPTEAIFEPPLFKPEDDGYYAAVEAWAERYLGVRFESARPDFLYEQDAPVGA